MQNFGRRKEDKLAQQAWGVSAFVHRLMNVKAFMKKLVYKDSLEYEMENLRFSIISFEKHFHMMRQKYYRLERILKDTNRLNYKICPKCAKTSYVPENNNTGVGEPAGRQ